MCARAPDHAAYRRLCIMETYKAQQFSSIAWTWNIYFSLFGRASSRCLMRAGVAQGGVISPVPLYLNYIQTPFRQVELAQYADDTALVATSGSTKLLVKYLEIYLIALAHWLQEWRIAIIVDKSTVSAVLSSKETHPEPPWLRFLGGEIRWVETARYLG